MNLDLDRILKLAGPRTGTHYEDCQYDHKECAIYFLVLELEYARMEIKELKEQIKFITSVHYG